MVDPRHWLFGALLALLIGALSGSQAADASPAPSGPQYPNVQTDVRHFRMFPANDPNADAVDARVKLRHRNLPGGRSLYSTITRKIPVKAIRKSAIRAVSRGRIHPALLAATVAADLYLNRDTGEVSHSQPVQRNVPRVEQKGDLATRRPDAQGSTDCGSTPAQECTAPWGPVTGAENWYATDRGIVHHWGCPSGSTGVWIESRSPGRSCVVGQPDLPPIPESEAGDPLTDQEKRQELDPEIARRADDLGDQIASDPQSDWSKDTAEDPAVNSDKGIPKKLRDAAKKDAQNAGADSAGEERPHPDQQTDTTTAEDEILDEMSDSGTPSFPDNPEPEWNVEMYGPDDLQEEDVNVAPAQCPEPYTFTVNVGGMVQEEIRIPYTEICTFAERVNPFFLAGAWVLAGFIVIRR